MNGPGGDGDDAPLELDVDGDWRKQDAPARAAAPVLMVKGEPAAAEELRCPRCGFAQAPAATCARCGVVIAKARRSDAPRRPSSVPAAPPPARSASVEGTAFWASLGPALMVPAAGAGALWLPLLGLFLVGGLFLGYLRLAFLGLLATYFARSVARGIDGEVRAPDIRWPSNFRAEVMLPGLAVMVLGALLWGPPAWVALSAVEDIAATIPEAVVQEGAAEAERVEELNPEEAFLDEQGKLVTFGEGSSEKIVKRADGRWVRVVPEEGSLTYLPERWAPGQPAPQAAPVESEVAPPAEDAAFGALWSSVKLPAGKIALLLLLLLFAVGYWPMAMTHAAINGSPLAAFNPIAVGKSAVQTAVPYAVVVVLGGAVLLAALLVGSRLPAVGMAAVFLGVLGYLSGVQGYLMGRLVAERPAAFPELKS